MKQSFMKRLYNIKERLYIEAKYLADYGFGIGQPIAYNIDQDAKTITVIRSEKDSKKHVAKTTQKTGKTVPVIDIKADEVRQFFAQHQQVQVEIQQGKIVFTVVEVAKSKENVVSFVEAKQERILLQERKYAISVNEFAKAVNYEQIDMFELFKAEYSEVKGSSSGRLSTKMKEKAIKMLSLFSGCGSMDRGFLDEGYDIVFANDRYERKALHSNHIETYRHNIGDHIIMGDVMDFTEADIPETDFVAAGIPCVRFSALNTINNFRDSESELFHPLVEQTINIIQWSNAKAFVIGVVPAKLSPSAN